MVLNFFTHVPNTSVKSKLATNEPKTAETDNCEKKPCKNISYFHCDTYLMNS